MKIKITDLKNFLISFFLLVVMTTGGALKYVAALFWVLFEVSINKGKVQGRMKLPTFTILMPSLIYFAIGGLLCMTSSISVYSIKDALFMFSSPFYIVLLWNYLDLDGVERCVKHFWRGMVIVSLMFSIRVFFSEGITESQYAFPMGIFIIYYIFKKDHLKVLLSFFILILSDKRIALGGVLATVIYYFVVTTLLKTRKQNSYKGKWLIGISAVVSIAIIMLYVYVCKYNIISSLFSYYEINSMGRINMWNRIGQLYEFSPGYIGKGIGYLTNLLYEWNLPGFRGNLHNDILKAYIELGFFGIQIYFLSYFFLIWKLNKKYRLDIKQVVTLLSCTLYTIILFTTDNVMIYVNYLMPFYMVVVCTIYSEKNRTEKVNTHMENTLIYNYIGKRMRRSE